MLCFLFSLEYKEVALSPSQPKVCFGLTADVVFVYLYFSSVFVFFHMYLYFSPVFALEIRGSVCEHLPGTKGPSARHHPQEAGGERNQSNQIPLRLTERHF